MSGYKIAGLDLPDAVSTPTGAPDVSTGRCLAANAHLLWHAIRETIRHSDAKVAAQHDHGIPGLLWRGNAQEVAERLWDGLDRSSIADGILADLYRFLHDTRRMARVDTGNKSRQWWVADAWDHPARNIPAPAELAETLKFKHPVLEALLASNGAVALTPPSAPAPPEPDYPAALQGLLDRYRWLELENKRLAAAASAGGDLDELTEENFSLRREAEEHRNTIRGLRQRVAALELIAGER